TSEGSKRARFEGWFSWAPMEPGWAGCVEVAPGGSGPRSVAGRRGSGRLRSGCEFPRAPPAALAGAGRSLRGADLALQLVVHHVDRRVHVLAALLRVEVRAAR